MNLAKMANRLVKRVNPNRTVTLFRVVGYDNSGLSPVLEYAEPEEYLVQVQPAEMRSLEHLDGFNISKKYLSFWFNVNIDFLNIPEQKNSDYIVCDGYRYFIVRHEYDYGTGWLKVTAVQWDRVYD